MTEILQQDVRPIEVVLQCDCGGIMQFTGKTLLSNPARYEHKCPACGYTTDMQERYPYLDYQRINGIPL